MNEPIEYAVRRNVEAKDSRGKPCRIALAVVKFPDGTGTTLAIPEGLLATVPPDKVSDFIASEVEAAIGYEVTRQ